MELLGAQRAHDRVEDTELQSGEGTDHYATSTKAVRAKFGNTNLPSDVDHALNDWAIAASAFLVHQGQQRVCWVGDNGRDDAGDGPGCQANPNVGSPAHLGWAAAQTAVHLFRGDTLHRKLGHRVWDLLEQHWAETRVEAAENTFILHQTRSNAAQAVGVGWVGHCANAARLQWAQEDICNEFGASRGTEVDGSAVVPGLLLTEGRGGLGLDQLDTAELEPALDEVADGGGAQTCGQRHGTLLSDHLSEAADHARVVLLWLELHAGLDNIDWADGAMREAAANTTRQS